MSRRSTKITIRIREKGLDLVHPPLFLVDPNMRIVSTANIPPQIEDWWKEKKQVVAQVLRRLPLELQAMVTQDLDATPITMDEAKRYRLELME